MLVDPVLRASCSPVQVFDLVDIDFRTRIMSVLLTGGKNPWSKLSEQDQKKHLKKKLSSHSMTRVDPLVPPFSNDRTSVWYWKLDGVQTIIMFNKVNYEVWCNGKTLSTKTTEKTDSPSRSSSHPPQRLEFDFQTTPENSSSSSSSGCHSKQHVSSIRLLEAPQTVGNTNSTPSSDGVARFVLTVDGCEVREHTGGDRRVARSSSSSGNHLLSPPAEISRRHSEANNHDSTFHFLFD